MEQYLEMQNNSMFLRNINVNNCRTEAVHDYRMVRKLDSMVNIKVDHGEISREKSPHLIRIRIEA